MTMKKEDNRVDRTKDVLVGIGFDKGSKELLGWSIVKVAEAGDHVVAVHVSRNSEDASKKKLLLDDYVEIFNGLCHIRKVKLTGKIVTGKSIRRGLVREAKKCDAVSLIVGITKFGSIGGWASTSKYCEKHLPSTTEILTVHNGKVVLKRSSNDHQPGLAGDPKPSYHKFEKFSGNRYENGDSEVSETDSYSPKLMMALKTTTDCILENKHAIVEVQRAPRRSVSRLCRDNVTEQRLGWPLLRKPSLPTQKALDSRKMSVVQWVMSLPERSPPETPQSSSASTCSTKSESPARRQHVSIDGAHSRTSTQAVWSELLEEPGLLFESTVSNFTWFSYKVIGQATSHFSSENLIGKGGCSRVYKGVFMDGKQVAVKVLRSSKQAWKDLCLEVNILSSLRHKNITPLLGVCIANGELICVYEFMSRGSLEENLHGEKKPKRGLPWEARYKVAVGIAEALAYLHTGCLRPVIHRDVKSSNILLSEDFEPQLSDFGLAIKSRYAESCSDVVGTFGYLAPEYFMYGKVSEKVDVYSFGVVLLELLSGRKPIDSCKGQESLVMWAKPRLELEMESGRLAEGLVDPMLEGSFEESEMRRLLFAATLCLRTPVGLRPNMGQILRLLKGEESVKAWGDASEEEDVESGEDELYKYHQKPHLIDITEDESTSCTCSYSSSSNNETPHLEDYLKGRCSTKSPRLQNFFKGRCTTKSPRLQDFFNGRCTSFD